MIVGKFGVGMLAVAALTLPASALAQAASNSGFRPEYRLTEQEKERILADAEAKNRNSGAKQGVIDLRQPPAIYGEVGFSIGTDGSRSAFGSAVYPFGGGSGAMISIDMDRFGHIPLPLIAGNPNR